MFDFVPKLIIFTGIERYLIKTGELNSMNQFYPEGWHIDCSLVENSYKSYFSGIGENAYCYAKKADDGKTISWYSNDSALEQFNFYSVDTNVYYVYHWITIA